jgi:phage baseplate assembly protein W
MAKLGVKLPITRDSADGYTMIGDFTTLIKQNFKMLILTNPGERVMLPDFGVGINQYLFENFSSSTYTDIETNIRKQTEKYLPVVTIRKITFEDSEQDNNRLGIAILYSIPVLGIKDLLQFTI